MSVACLFSPRPSNPRVAAVAVAIACATLFATISAASAQADVCDAVTAIHDPLLPEGVYGATDGLFRLYGLAAQSPAASDYFVEVPGEPLTLVHDPVDDSRALCPNDWHVPTDGEWTQLTDFLGGLDYADTPMKASPNDNPGWNGSNTSGFTGLPGGTRVDDGYFGGAGGSGYWWSSSPSGSSAWYRSLFNNGENASRYDVNPRYGFSVRCVRDAE